MSTCVFVTGLPAKAKLSSIIFLIKKLFAKNDIGQFWVTDQSDIRGTDLKATTISFASDSDAHSCVSILNGFLYRSGKELFPLQAEIERRSQRAPSPRRRACRSPVIDRYRDERSRERRKRSRSPLQEEASKLDLEIELLRKKRLIIEEERRLLLESKKLEMIKEYGHDAVRDVDSFVDEDRSRHRDYGRREEYDRRRRDDHDRHRDDRRRDDFDRRRDVDRRRRDDDHRREYRRRTPPRRPPPSFRRSPRRDKLYINKERLPKFRTPVIILLKEMKQAIAKHKSQDEAQQQMIRDWLRVNIRQRITKLLENTSEILSFVQICDIYRKAHPQSTDDDFVKKVVEDVTISHKFELDGEEYDIADAENAEVDETLAEEIGNAQTENEIEQLESVNCKVETIEDTNKKMETEDTKPNEEETAQKVIEMTEDLQEKTQETINKVEPGLENTNVNEGKIDGEKNQAVVKPMATENDCDINKKVVDVKDNVNEGKIKEENNQAVVEPTAVTDVNKEVLDGKEDETESNNKDLVRAAEDEVNNGEVERKEGSTESVENVNEAGEKVAAAKDNTEWAEGTVDWN